MKRTFDAPAFARTGSGQAGSDSLIVRPMTPGNAVPRGYSLIAMCPPRQPPQLGVAGPRGEYGVAAKRVTSDRAQPRASDRAQPRASDRADVRRLRRAGRCGDDLVEVVLAR